MPLQSLLAKILSSLSRKKEEPKSLMCDECQEKFNKQQGQLMLRDMCEECRRKHLHSILESADDNAK